jgi:hypothetical protein
LELYKLLTFLLIFIILFSNISYGVEYLVLDADGNYAVLKDHYVPTDEEEKAVNDIVAAWCKRNNSSDDLQMYYRIRNYIARKVTYDNDKKYSYSAYGALIRGRAVCMGYALLAKKFFDYKKMENYLIWDLKENHLYNRILLNGKWEDVDITWYDYGLEKLERWYAGR